jgi:FtsZ-binding cell division protein ZapB
MDLKKQILTALGMDNEVQLEFQAKLTDGTIIVSEAEALAEGIAISILAEDGSQMPLPVGVYELEDGTTFEVTEEGIVASIGETEETEEEVVEEEVEAAEEERQPKKIKETTEVEFDKVAFIDEVKAVVDELVAKTTSDIEKLQSEIDELKEANGNLETEKEELSSQVEKLSKEPAEKPVTTNKFTEKKELSKVDYKKLSRQEKYWYNINNLKK